VNVCYHSKQVFFRRAKRFLWCLSICIFHICFKISFVPRRVFAILLRSPPILSSMSSHSSSSQWEVFPWRHPVLNDFILFDETVASLDGLVKPVVLWTHFFGYTLGHQKICFPPNFASCRQVFAEFGQKKETSCMNGTPERYLHHFVYQW